MENIAGGILGGVVDGGKNILQEGEKNTHKPYSTGTIFLAVFKKIVYRK